MEGGFVLFQHIGHDGEVAVSSLYLCYQGPETVLAQLLVAFNG